MIISVTGHRNKYFPCKYNENHPWYKGLVLDVEKALKQEKPDILIQGLALGFDMLCAEAALRIGVPVWSYVPFKGQGDNWPKTSQIRYKNILDKSNKVVYTAETYSNEAFWIRDKAMIDDSDKVFALLNPLVTSGGTFITYTYAKKQNKEITNFWRD